jgi:small subunit ribosomal protein S4
MFKGLRCETARCPMERDWRRQPPGMHGWRRGKGSDYALRLREKQKVKRYYGLLEKGFMRFFRRAERAPGNTGQELLCLLERRLDNVVCKLGFAPSRRSARQMVIHGHVAVNGRKLDRPGYLVCRGDKIAAKDRDKSKKMLRQSMEGEGQPTIQPWLSLQTEPLQGEVVNLPGREDVQIPVEEQLIVELCSR